MLSRRATENRQGALIAVFLIAAAALHAVYVVHHRVNSDEPQHLHVAWAWVQGLLPYRDVFDNHSPLFSLVMAPVVRAIGERPDIVFLARLAMLPFAALALALAWIIGRNLFSIRAAFLAVALCALVPDFMLGSVEYRTDVLWTVLWMAAMAILLTGPPTRSRFFLFGVAVGAALGTSMKTSLLVLSLMAAGAATLYMLRARGSKLPLSSLAMCGASALAGVLLVPALLAAFFATQGAWKPMLYGTLSHNLVPNLGLWREGAYRALILPAALPLLWIVGRRIIERAKDPFLGAKRALLFLTAGIYYTALYGIWPLITRQDLLPFLPMAAVVAAPCFLALPGLARRWRPGLQGLARAAAFAPAAVLALEIAWTQRVEPVWQRNDTQREASLLDEVLRLTRRGDTVMDLKGETIFRERPFYFALEAITEARIADGSIRDDIPERLIARRTPVAIADTPEFPERGREFLNMNYIPLGELRVLGQRLGPQDGSATASFEIGVPQRYVILCERGDATGLLDGIPYDGPRELARGRHTYVGSRSEGGATLLWAEAVRRENPKNR